MSERLDVDVRAGFRAAFDPAGEHVRLRGNPDLSLPATFEVSVDLAELPCLVVLDVDAASGAPVCRAVRCYRRPGGPPMSTALLRRVPVDRLMTEAIGRLQ